MMLKFVVFLAAITFCACQPPPTGFLQVNSPPEIAGQYFAATITYKGTPPNLIGSSMNGTLTSIANLTTWLPGNILLVFNSGLATDFYLRNFFPLIPRAIVIITFRLGKNFQVHSLKIDIYLNFFLQRPRDLRSTQTKSIMLQMTL